MDKVNLSDKLSRFTDHWSPKIVGELNGQQVKLAKLKGEFIWHAHTDEDELFLVLDGRLVIQLRDGEVVLDPGELVIVPRGVEHRPVAEEEVHVLLFEPGSTVNTGTLRNERTVDRLDWI
jgi:mannose-6-phosphate isomerase-like protein (cupin superfamily)